MDGKSREVAGSESETNESFRMGLLVMIAVCAGTFACILALPAHSLAMRRKSVRWNSEELRGL